ncbi:MAG: hypothetical protein COA68_17560 [Oceanobacter sp.]|nr:MAG: hypothetical protein COA68_17560 [Oceanobacter sp.]
MNNSVLEITSKNGSALGTGFVVKLDENGGYVATCGHVVISCGDDILVNEQSSTVFCNKYSDGLDLAILYVPDLKLPPFQLALAGESKVKVVGYSKIIGKNKKEIISNISIKNGVEIDSVKSIKLYPKEDICEGYSGSPVLCEVTNDVVGIVNIKSGQENYAISSEHLAGLVDVSLNALCNSNKVNLTTKLNDIDKGIIHSKLQENLDNALSSFSSQKNLWVTPHLDKTPEEKSGDTDRVDIATLIENPHSVVIKSRQQYGATSLAHYLVNQAWANESPSFWLYLDSSKLKPHRKAIEKEVNKTLKRLGLSYDDIECVILDEFSLVINNASKLLTEVNEFFKDKPIILMYSLDENPLVNESIQFPRKFTKLFLWALDRKGVRSLVNNYNSDSAFEDDTRVLNKVVNDLEALNIPRTPQNCLTILKITELGFDDSPVNRAEMISRVLHMLFNIDEIPDYKTRPDLKDTEFTLGYFCEEIIKNKKIYFTREYFIKKSTAFCTENEIDLEIDVIFDILFSNNIIVNRNEGFCFKFTYWIYYFAGHRMLHDSDFSDYILDNLNYLNYPEIIEFYTGIDRRRNDALKIIIKDLNSIERIVNEKCKLPEEFDIFKLAKWLPSDKQLESMEKEILEGVKASSLPDEIKDEYADRTYNRKAPLTQNLHNILEEYSLLRLMQGIKSGSLALRNSDFADKKLKHKLLDSVLQGIKQLTNVLVALSPVLALDNEANVDGASFVLSGGFSNKLDEKLNEIITCIPSNMIDWYVDQLFSQKMGTLVNNRIGEESDSFKHHYLNLMLIAKRPKSWESNISNYILSIDKNSFYLLDVINALNSEYKFSYTSDANINKIGDLIKLCSGKHERLLKNLSVKKAHSLSDNYLPDRQV